MRRASRSALVAALLVLAAMPASARVARTAKVKFPRVTVPPRSNTELCAFVRVPEAEVFDMTGAVIRNAGIGRGFSVIHFLVYEYRGEHLAEFAAEQGRVVQSKGCLDLGPADRDHRLLIASGIARKNRRVFPGNLVLPLEPRPDGIGILMDANLENDSSKPRRFSSTVVLKRAKSRTPVRRLTGIFERTSEQGLVVPPFSIRSTEATTLELNAARPTEVPLLDSWGPGIPAQGEPAPAADACVLILSSQMHKRTRFIGVDLVGTDGMVRPPTGNGLANPLEPGRSHLWGAPDYTDPGDLTSFPGLLVRSGERLRYACWIDNGVTTAVRLGCEESAGVAPGVAAALADGGPAKPCHGAAASSPECPPTDPAFPGRTFTGACVPANSVAGPTPDDEACILTGFYYDAAGGGCG